MNTSPKGARFVPLQSAVPGILRPARVKSRPRHRRVRPPSPHAKAAPEPPTRVTRQLLPRHGRAKAASTKPLPPLQAVEPSHGPPGPGRRPRGACQAPGPLPSAARPMGSAAPPRGRAPRARRSPGAVWSSHMADPGRPGPLPAPLPARSHSHSHPELIPLAAVPLPGDAPAAGGAPGPLGNPPRSRRGARALLPAGVGRSRPRSAPPREGRRL